MKTRIEKANSSITTKQNSKSMLHISSFNVGMVLEGKYEIKREISRGGMGIVYEAYHQYLHKEVAIKVILGNKIDSLQLKRFEKEIEACSRLFHPNVIKIYDAGTYENNPYIVMEYIDGVNIGQYIEQQDKAFGQEDNAEKKERDWKLCAKLIYETALGLEYIHKQKMFHRDIKPSNIIVRSDGSPVIIDMGLVKFNQERSYNLTRSRDIIGTCQYMPIEQVQGKRGKVDARSDVYSLGLVLYELLTEQRAYNGKNATEVFNKIASYYPPLPREINPQIPEVLEEITMHAIEKQKEKRYATAQEFADALKKYLDGTTTQTTSKYAHYKKRLWLQRNKNKIVASCIVILVLVNIITISMLGFSKKENNQNESHNQQNLQSDAEIQYKLGLMYTQGKEVKQDYAKAIEYYKKAAIQGHEEAQYKLGIMYFQGDEIQQDYQESIYWLEKAAIQGNIEAQGILGFMYQFGKGIKIDLKKAIYWLEKAAIQGRADSLHNLGIIYLNHNELEKAISYFEKATQNGSKESPKVLVQLQNNLGEMYYSGKNREQDYQKAFECFEKAVKNGELLFPNNIIDITKRENGIKKNIGKSYDVYEQSAQEAYIKAQLNLADLYQQGKGTKQDYKKALDLYEKIAIQGIAEAQHSLGEMYYLGRGVKEDNKQAFFWYEKAAIQGIPEAQNRLGEMYYLGRGVKEDNKQAFFWYEKAAIQGYIRSQHNLAVLYDRGEGVEQDYQKAIFWYEKAANQGMIESQHNLGSSYYKGKGVEQDYIKAFYWFSKAANQGMAESQYVLGVMYENGQGVKEDYQKAFFWYEKATIQGHSQAQYNLGLLYYNGKGVEQDYTKALELFKKSAKQGNKNAKQILNEITKQKVI